MTEAHKTTDHNEIRRWAEARGGKPATVETTESDHEPGILRLEFEPNDDKLETISWESFFQKFEEADLAFLYQDKTSDGKTSRFHKFIRRKDDDDDDG